MSTLQTRILLCLVLYSLLLAQCLTPDGHLVDSRCMSEWLYVQHCPTCHLLPPGHTEFRWLMSWTEGLCPPPNSYVKLLTLNAMVVGDGAFERLKPNLPLKPSSPAEFMINLSIQNFIPFLLLPPFPSGLRSIKEKRGLESNRTLWGLPGYKDSSVAPISCL